MITIVDVTKFRGTLRARSAVLREEIRQAAAALRPRAILSIAEQVRDAEDKSFADLMIDVNMAELDRDLAELRAIDHTLEHLAAGTYRRRERYANPQSQRAVVR